MGGCISSEAKAGSASDALPSNGTKAVSVVPSGSSGKVGQCVENNAAATASFAITSATLPPLSAEMLGSKASVGIPPGSSPTHLESSSAQASAGSSASSNGTNAGVMAAVVDAAAGVEAGDAAPAKEPAGAAAVPATAKPSDSDPASLSSDSDSDAGGDKDDGDDDDDDDDDDEDDDAELSPERAREIAEATAALRIVHSVAPRKVRGILSTANAKAGVGRPLTAMQLTQRKKGIRWNVTEGLWSERAPSAPTIQSSATKGDPAAAAFAKKLINARNAGEKWIGSRKRSSGSFSGPAGSTDSKSASPHVSPGAALRNLDLSTSAGVPAEPDILAPGPMRSPPHHHLPPLSTSSPHAAAAGSVAAASSPAPPAAPSPGTPVTPRQYTSSARVAGSSSFKARMNAGSDKSDSPSLSHTLSTSTNFLLRLSPNQLIHLSWVSLQQLFLLYSKAGRNYRDRGGAWAEKEKKGRAGHTPKNTRKQSESTGLNSLSLSSNVPAGQAFLLSAGVDPPAGSLTLAQATAAATAANTWIELDASCPMALEEMEVLALHLVQKKLELLAKELAAQPAVINGKTKLTSLLKTARFNLFPAVLGPMQAQPAPQPNSDTASGKSNGKEAPLPRFEHTAASTPHALRSESEIGELFVKCTVQTMQDKLGKNNFGEIQWGGMMDHWKSFALYFFLFRADTNPLGVVQPTKEKEKNTQAASKCAIM